MIGVVVDGVSGAMLDHCPNPVRITLRSLPASTRGRQTQAAAGGFTYDPVAACKVQIEKKYATNVPPSDSAAR